jgi:hypothetical protein
MQTILQWLYLGIIFWGGAVTGALVVAGCAVAGRADARSERGLRRTDMPVSWSRIDRTQV